jgi:hypothetical protein
MAQAHGKSPNGGVEPVATGGVCINPLRNAEGNERHWGADDDGTATATR